MDYTEASSTSPLNHTDMKRRPKLQLIEGHRNKPVRLGPIALTVSSGPEPPFPVAMQVIEEDTWRVLSAAPSLKGADTHPVRVMTGLIDQEARQAGEVLVRGRRCLAIIYDLDHDPICRPEWIRQAMGRILERVEEDGIRSLALPLLGSSHGPMDWTQSLDIIIHELQVHGPECLERLCLTVNRQDPDKVRLSLEQYCG